LKRPPTTLGDNFIFFPSSGDPAFASPHEMQTAIDYTRKYSDCTFFIQSKNPECFLPYKFPENVILGITLETDLRLYHTPSLFTMYQQISKAPIPIERTNHFEDVKHKRKMVTIEPILDFKVSILTAWIYRINPEIIYIGYDNHNCKLPEPALAKNG